MILIIAYGNKLRRDDGAGLLLGGLIERWLRLHNTPVKRIEVQQLLPELALDMAHPSVSGVIFVDTRTASHSEKHLHVDLYPFTENIAAQRLGHTMNAETLLLYAEKLYGRKLPAWLVTIPGIDFGYGEGVSWRVEQALHAAQERLAGLLTQLVFNLATMEG